MCPEKRSNARGKSFVRSFVRCFFACCSALPCASLFSAVQTLQRQVPDMLRCHLLALPKGKAGEGGGGELSHQ